MDATRSLVALLYLVAAAAPAQTGAQQLTAVERRIAQHVDAYQADAIALLEATVNINSGTANPAGVRRVYDAMAPEFEKLGFAVHYAMVPDSLNRGGHLVAERKGARGPRLLLIGHLDTVFEEDSPFQRFVRIDDTTAAGPGVEDMKGGNIVILQALRALHSVGALDNTTITVVLTGDEEDPGSPLDVARAALIEAGKRSDIALGFESGSQNERGIAQAVVARRSSTDWLLTIDARPAHSSGVFRDNVGAGAIYEAARILDAFYGELRGEEYLTFNAGVIVGGNEVAYDPPSGRGRAAGKTNIVPQRAVVHGDIRTITDEQLQRTRERMRHIVAQGLPHAQAAIRFGEGYPAMSPTPANYELLERYSAASRALGLGPVEAHDPGRRGAADISFVAPYVKAGLDGLGPYGSGGHTVNERVELPTLAQQAKRAALLIYRLTRG